METFVWHWTGGEVRGVGEHQQDAFTRLSKEDREKVTHADGCFKVPTREPRLVRAARFILEHGAEHVDNFTGCIVNDVKVTRAAHAQGRPDIYEMAEDEERTHADEPLVIRRKRGGPKINPVLLDATTAAMVIKVYEALNEKNKASFPAIVERFTVVGTVTRLWKLVK